MWNEQILRIHVCWKQHVHVHVHVQHKSTNLLTSCLDPCGIFIKGKYRYTCTMYHVYSYQLKPFTNSLFRTIYYSKENFYTVSPQTVFTYCTRVLDECVLYMRWWNTVVFVQGSLNFPQLNSNKSIISIEINVTIWSKSEHKIWLILQRYPLP